MKNLLSTVALYTAVLFGLVCAVSGCATIGIRDQPQEQAVLEAAAALMAMEYMDIKNDESLSDADIARALLKVGDKAVKTQGYVSFAALLESRLSAVTNGKFHPNVYMIYMLTIAVLESLEEPLEA